LDKKKEALLIDIIQEHLSAGTIKNFKVLFKFSDDQYNHFNALYSNLSNSFSKSFRQITGDLKRQQSSLMHFRKKLQDAESKENDPVIKRVRQDKIKLEQSIRQTEEELISLEANMIQQQHELASNTKVLNELAKKIRVEDVDKAKDETAERLIAELTDFIRRLKLKKKVSLENNIQTELNRLMHKQNFVNRVEAVIEGDLIDIELYDSKEQLINKEGLSKGEQQLYATALLKALIAESNIQFPVFIDSPLQKFDKEHSRNIIEDFYPQVSVQVVLFPLLEKELNEEEYKSLLPHTANVYLIKNAEEYCSSFVEVKPSQLFKTYRDKKEYVNEQ
jgi:DNA sulfur modification protein DndD